MGSTTEKKRMYAGFRLTSTISPCLRKTTFTFVSWARVMAVNKGRGKRKRELKVGRGSRVLPFYSFIRNLIFFSKSFGVVWGLIFSNYAVYVPY